MRPYVGAGWHIHSITDRMVWLKKEDATYRALTGDDGFVKVRIEPQMTRDQAVQRAIEDATKMDERLSLMVADQLIPSARQTRAYRAKLQQLAPVFRVRGEETRRYRA